MELGPVDPHGMQDDRQIVRHGDLGLLEANAFPQPVTPGFELAPVLHPGEQHAGGLEQVGPEHSIAALGDPPAPVDLARGIAARRQSDIGAHRPGAPEAGRLVDHRAESQGGDRSDARHRHGAPAVGVIPRQAQELAVESGDLSPDLLADLQKGSNGLPQKTVLAKQLLDPATEDSAARLARTSRPGDHTGDRETGPGAGADRRGRA